MDESANHIALRARQPGAADRMRDLLARTVQDHVSDQRSQVSTLEGIRKHLEGLEWLVKEVRQDGLSDLSSQLAIQTDGLLRELEQRLAELHQHELKLQQSMESAAGRFSRLDMALTELQVQVAHGRLERLDKRLSDTGDEIDAMDSKFGALDTKLTGTDGKVGALANRIDRLDDHIGDTDDRVGLINERIGSINDRIGSIDGHMAIVDERTAPLADELRLRPGHTEVVEIVTKVVAAAEAAMAARLDSLEETALTLAEALLRPTHRMPGQRRGDDQS